MCSFSEFLFKWLDDNFLHSLIGLGDEIYGGAFCADLYFTLPSCSDFLSKPSSKIKSPFTTYISNTRKEMHSDTVKIDLTYLSSYFRHLNCKVICTLPGVLFHFVCIGELPGKSLQHECMNKYNIRSCWHPCLVGKRTSSIKAACFAHFSYKRMLCNNSGTAWHSCSILRQVWSFDT